jgi:hypothetical protein
MRLLQFQFTLHQQHHTIMTQPANSTFQLGELGMFEMVFTYQGRSSDETGKEKFSFRAVVKRNGEKASDNLADPESFSNRRPEDLVVGVHNGTDGRRSNSHPD